MPKTKIKDFHNAKVDVKFLSENRDTVNRRVLLLNSSEEVLRMISWQRAVALYWENKVVAPYNFDHNYIIKTNIGDFDLPSALVLVEYANVPYRIIRPTRENIFLRDKLICQYSGVPLKYKDATIDHIQPKSRGGKHEWTNVVCSERKLNIKKSNRTPAEAGLQLLSKPHRPTHAELVINSATQEQREHWARWMRVKE